MDISGTLEHVQCSVCKDYADNPVETECCRKLFCKVCLKFSQDCPECGSKDAKYRENFSVKKIIEDIEQECPNGCGERTTRKNLSSHLKVCHLRNYHCPTDYCTFSGLQEKFLQHMVDEHRHFALERLTCLPQPPPPDYTPGKFVNKDGNLAIMGRNAKFYCGQGQVLKRRRMSDSTTKMEKGICGPATTRGSNCNACMSLDISFRSLPIGFLVNADGIVSTPVACIHGRHPQAQGLQRRRASNVIPCSLSRCGTTPVYYCERPHATYNETDGTYKATQKCQALNRCSACNILRLQLENGAYEDVWETGE